MKKAVRTGQILLAAITVLLYGIGVLLIRETALPYTALAGLGVLFVDLFLYSPIKAGTATLCRFEAAKADASHGFLYYGFMPQTYLKAVVLRLRIWKSRVIRYAVFLLPSAFFSLLSERMYATVTVTYNTQVIGLIFHGLALSLLILGIIFIEISLLRYKAAWYMLTLCNRAKQAIKVSKSLSVCRMSEILSISLTAPFASVSISYATWVVSQTQNSRHVYIFSENTNTVMGTTDA